MKVRLLVLDVDGVLTDGTFFLSGERDEWKGFYAPDGFGIRMLVDAGMKVAFLTGRTSATVERRARELGISLALQGRRDKAEALGEICRSLAVTEEETAYMGDDLVDLPAMRRAAFAAAPADARPEVIEAARFVAPSRGGRGAVRDLCEHLLRAQGLWERAAGRFLA